MSSIRLSVEWPYANILALIVEAHTFWGQTSWGPKYYKILDVPFVKTSALRTEPHGILTVTNLGRLHTGNKTVASSLGTPRDMHTALRARLIQLCSIRSARGCS